MKLRNVLDKKIKDNVFKERIKQKENHSKVRKVQYNQFEMQKYLRPCKIQIRKEEAQEIFKLRSRVSDVKTNYIRENMKNFNIYIFIPYCITAD